MGRVKIAAHSLKCINLDNLIKNSQDKLMEKKIIQDRDQDLHQEKKPI